MSGKPILRQSDLGLLELCAYAYYLKNIMRIPEPKSWAATKGTACHKAREKNFTAKIQTKQDLPLSDCQDAARDAVNQETQTGEFLKDPDLDMSIKDAAGAVIDRAIGLVKMDHTLLYPTIQPERVEQQVVAELPGYEFDLQGKLDLTIPRKIVDLKTSKRKWDEDRPYESNQPATYGILFRADQGFWPEGFRFDILVDTKEPKTQVFEIQISDARYQGVLDRYSNLAQMIQAGIFPPCSPGHWKCDIKYCGYYPTCKYSKR